LLASHLMKSEGICKAAAARNTHLRLGEKYKKEIEKGLVKIPSDNTIKAYLAKS